MDGWTDGLMVGRMDGWTDGRVRVARADRDGQLVEGHLLERALVDVIVERSWPIRGRFVEGSWKVRRRFVDGSWHGQLVGRHRAAANTQPPTRAAAAARSARSRRRMVMRLGGGDVGGKVIQLHRHGEGEDEGACVW